MTKIPIVYAADNNYVLPTIVSITSLLENKNSNTFYTIFILDTGITDENKKEFYWKKFNTGYELHFIGVNLGELVSHHAYGSWTPTIYAKYYISDLLPDYDKCLWLDGDTIIQKDLGELYDIDLGKNYLGAVMSPETNYNVAAENHYVLERSTYNLKCINVGVLLLNLKLLRNIGGGNFLHNETLNSIAALPNDSIVTEQDIINKVLTTKIIYLPLKYNTYVDNFSFIGRPYYPFCFDRKTIEEALLDPVVIHYTLPEKPWIYKNAEKMYDRYFKKYRALWDCYYRLSPFVKNHLPRKRISNIQIFYHFIKPLLKKSTFLLSIKRKSYKTHIESTIHDFFD
jgi:lipopolysaccharide biosynthesis glycosyltransferase